MNFGLRGHDVSAQNIEELAYKFKKLGIGCIQLVLKKSVLGFCEGMFSPSYAKKIGSEFLKNDIDIAILGCYINPSNTDKTALKKDMDYFIECLKYAKFLNAGAVGLETGFVGEECIAENNHTEEAYQYLLSNMRVLCNAAEKLGVMIAVEGVKSFVIDTPQKMNKLINDLNSPNICVILDVLNYLDINNYLNQDKIIEESFSLFGDKLAAIHLKDFIVQDGKLEYVYLKSGLMNTDLILSYANKYKPEIPIILEEAKEDKAAEVITRLQI